MGNLDNDSKASSVESEYEWGIRFRGASGSIHEEWGYGEDPRIMQVVDADGEFYFDGDYREVHAVGKRLKSPESWEIL